ncbi:hypothetical protein P152DRAFT_298745 [Eremomyces bilateralis CBS 781.70]|uniref:DUF4048 domain-containing protein n=1 Tax=Eremomyces bilateralis CBS 781.70 TaxID=1392243 RepID=A0A6G1G782_9PEZI|nr:uncharacterized protein P152DRAFT_298745 [Eremomyces bilateralis CBS 781.70]KAF1813937.1 hypothetical protein P152DRAFT_298745 [Eremomyces bilateralis CBS 781.70]
MKATCSCGSEEEPQAQDNGRMSSPATNHGESDSHSPQLQHCRSLGEAQVSTRIAPDEVGERGTGERRCIFLLHNDAPPPNLPVASKQQTSTPAAIISSNLTGFTNTSTRFPVSSSSSSLSSPHTHYILVPASHPPSAATPSAAAGVQDVAPTPPRPNQRLQLRQLSQRIAALLLAIGQRDRRLLMLILPYARFYWQAFSTARQRCWSLTRTACAIGGLWLLTRLFLRHVHSPFAHLPGGPRSLSLHPKHLIQASVTHSKHKHLRKVSKSRRRNSRELRRKATAAADRDSDSDTGSVDAVGQAGSVAVINHRRRFPVRNSRDFFTPSFQHQNHSGYGTPCPVAHLNSSSPWHIPVPNIHDLEHLDEDSLHALIMSLQTPLKSPPRRRRGITEPLRITTIPSLSNPMDHNHALSDHINAAPASPTTSTSCYTASVNPPPTSPTWRSSQFSSITAVDTQSQRTRSSKRFSLNFPIAIPRSTTTSMASGPTARSSQLFSLSSRPPSWAPTTTSSGSDHSRGNSPPTFSPNRTFMSPTHGHPATSLPALTSPTFLPPPETNFLTILAAQERKVLELREELGKAEAELGELKKKWERSEARKKREELRSGMRLRDLAGPAAMPPPPAYINDGDGIHEMQLRSATTPRNKRLSDIYSLGASDLGPYTHDQADLKEEEDPDGSNAWMTQEMERRKSLLRGSTMGPAPGSATTRYSQRKVFSGSRHTRALSLLSPDKERVFDRNAALDALEGRTRSTSPPDASFPPPPFTRASAEHDRTAIAEQKPRSRRPLSLASGLPQPPSRSRTLPILAPIDQLNDAMESGNGAPAAILRTAKQTAEGLKDGLWTFFEDIRQATVGEEGAREMGGVAQRSLSPGKRGQEGASAGIRTGRVLGRQGPHLDGDEKDPAVMTPTRPRPRGRDRTGIDANPKAPGDPDMLSTHSSTTDSATPSQRKVVEDEHGMEWDSWATPQNPKDPTTKPENAQAPLRKQAVQERMSMTYPVQPGGKGKASPDMMDSPGSSNESRESGESDGSQATKKDDETSAASETRRTTDGSGKDASDPTARTHPSPSTEVPRPSASIDESFSPTGTLRARSNSSRTSPSNSSRTPPSGSHSTTSDAFPWMQNLHLSDVRKLAPANLMREWERSLSPPAEERGGPREGPTAMDHEDL